ncbi:Peptidase C54 [Penicillium riverlandense]|uniref:Peptidase C54 n=1 Tax=Penicillium riverlandense TaxID=1903569 RepID=UPI0025465D42|nr:Peptidase C54 [Penicillium riverlandense]KAJ5819663.1 Peptidase C54 [Penicillium riverlandense]
MTGVDLEKCKRIVQYFWDPEPKNDATPDAPIWCLGREYAPSQHTADEPIQAPAGPVRETDSHKESPNHQTLDTSNSSSGHPPESISPNDPPTTTWPDAFLADFESRLWITYRSNFTPIPKSNSQEAASSMTLSVRLRSQLMDSQGFTSDTGWGCMIRSGQSLLANTLAILSLGRDWRRGEQVAQESKLISMFTDHPDSLFSIHQFVQCGARSCGKYPGEWFGPSATARCIQILSGECTDPKLRVYVTNDTSDVYEDKFTQVACDGAGHIQPTLILLGLRLGIDHVTPVYRDGLRATLQYPQSVGIAGGRPSASHYFVGVQDGHLFYLDPHLTRPALPPRDADEPYTQEELDSYHTSRLRRIHIKDMDPSMLIGFLIKDEADWTDWKRRVGSTPGQPIVHILPGEKPPTQGQERREALDEVEVLDDSDAMED